MFKVTEYVEKKAENVVTLSLHELKRLCYHYKLPHFVVDGEKAKITLPKGKKKTRPFKLHFTTYNGLIIRAFEE